MTPRGLGRQAAHPRRWGSQASLLVPLLAPLLVPTEGAAQSAGSAPGAERYEDVSFTPPPGWRVERLSDAVRLTPPDQQPFESLYVYLVPGRPAAGTLAQELERAWPGWVATLGGEPMRTVNGGMFDADEPGRSRLGWEYQRATGGFRAQGAGFAMDLYVMRAGERTGQVLVLAPEFRHEYSMVSPLQNPRYARAVREMIFSLRFANLPEVGASRAGLRAGGVVGLWAGFAMSFGRIKPHVAVLFDDGTAYFGPNPPARGLLDIDPAVEAPGAPRYWGDWELQGGRGRLRMPYGEVPVRADGAALELTTSGTPHRYVRWTTPPASLLEGEWCLAGGECLLLLAGGRFEDRGAVLVLEHATYTVPESPAGGRGAFELRDHTLVLRYDGGPEIRVAALGVPEGDPGAPTEIVLGFNMDVLTRR